MHNNALAADFEAHADEALQVANATFEAAAETTWPRDCMWPECLSTEQQLQLADEIGCDLVGETHPEPAVYDQRATCRCIKAGGGGTAERDRVAFACGH